MQARLLYRDGLMLVIDKPPGLPVHRGPKGVEAFEDYFDALRFGLPRPPSLAHRLDRDTTGCLVLGRHRKALALLGKLFKQGKVGKTYWAVVEGGPVEETGTIDIALSKRDESRGWWMKADPQGLPSVTTWQVMGRASVPQTLVSPPPCGEGSGVGVDVDRNVSSNDHPPPQPSPTRGEGAGCGKRRDSEATHLARAHAGHRAHASIARALRRDGLPDRRRQHLRQRAAQRRTDIASTRARSRRAHLEEQAAGDGDRAGAAAYAGVAGQVRVERKLICHGRACPGHLA